MKNVESIPKILKINEVKGYKVSCLFNNGESRIINFKELFLNLKNYSKKHPAYKLIQDKKAFDQIEVLGNTIGWKNTGIYSTDVTGKKVFYHYDLDPIVLLESSETDNYRNMLDWEAYFLYQSKKGVSENTIAICDSIIQDIRTAFKLNDGDFSLGDTMVTYYVDNKIFGNIKFNKNSLRIEPVFAGNNEIGYRIQTDGYVIHSFKITTQKEYQEKKDLIFELLKDVHEKKRNGEYGRFIDTFSSNLKKYLNRIKK